MLIFVSADARRNELDVKIYDFQLYFYHSFTLDLIFFLFTSVRIDVLNKNFVAFIRVYHRRFFNTLKDVNCPTQYLQHYTIELYAIREGDSGYFFQKLTFSSYSAECGRKSNARPKWSFCMPFS